METRAFSFMNVPIRSEKPRETGITMMVDMGLGVAKQRDILDIGGAYIDLGKIAVGLSGVISERLVKEKIKLYSDYQVETFIGGQFLEYGIYHQGLKVAHKYFEEAKRLGFKVIEVSDNNLEITLEEKFELIRMGREDFGLKILGEVGTKTEVTSSDAMVRDIENCLSAGAWKVFVEAAELVDKTDGSLLVEVIDAIVKAIGFKEIIFELPGPWISNVRTCDIHDMQVFLFSQFGPEINVANVSPDDIMELETLRMGVGSVLDKS